jgi:hypothetical protein
MTKRWGLIQILLLGLLLPGIDPVGADEKVRVPDDPSQARKILVDESLRLDDAKAIRFWPLYERYQKELDHFRKARLDLLSNMGENYDNMSESDAQKIIDERLHIERGRVELLERTTREMGQILTHRELARFLQIELKIKAFIDAGIEEEIPILQ